ncbi:MAG TPA: tetratricopeptide repeat protein [Aestuariivirgaceae bacterium]|nr:tetratricopeptide repeat protein [Aestuariivirgaceae bacterium]
MERRLSAILAADVVGYSRLMGEDEEGTLAALKRLLSNVFAPSVAEHHGRIVKEIGDGFLVEFASVVDAVNCAVAVQEAIANLDYKDPERRIELRIGINLGDVIVEGDDIYGDGVNVAARLEGLAEPGGICLSRAARDQVRDRLEVALEDLGEVTVKNIRRPVRVFRVMQARGVSSTAVRPRRLPGRQWVIAATAAMAAAVGAAAGLAMLWPQGVERASVERMAFPLPDRPSLAVLPFDDLSVDAEQGYFAQGITEDLITDLSKLSGMFVIARNSSFVYAGNPVPVRQAAEELGVQYILEGSVRRDGMRVRINAQLVDALSGGHLWADRYDGTVADVFGFQDQVTREIVSALAVSLTGAEEVGHTEGGTTNSDAYDAFLRGWAHFRRHTPDDFAEAVKYLKTAIELDPSYGQAYAGLAAVYSAILDNNWSTGTSYWSNRLGLKTDDVVTALADTLDQALEHPTALAHSVSATSKSRIRDYQGAISAAKTAISLDPNEPAGHLALAASLILGGHPQQAVASLEQALRLDPKEPSEALYWLGLAYFGMEKFDEAANHLNEAVAENPDDDRSLIVLAATNGFLGDTRLARQLVQQADRIRAERQKRYLAPGWRPGIDYLLTGPYSLQDVDWWSFNEVADLERLKEGLRLAGVPEQGEGEQVSPLEVVGATTVDPADAKALHDRGVPFVDVRPLGMFEVGCIPGGIHLDFVSTFNQDSLLAVADKGSEIVIYCGGPRCLLSSRATAAAVSWGFRRLYYFRDGFPAWRSAGYPVEIPTK